MASVIFIIAVFNLFLGYALAVCLEGDLDVPLPRISWPGSRSQSATDDLPEGDEPEEASESADSESQPIRASKPEIAPEEVIPSAWIQILEQNGIEVESFVEAAIEVMKLEVGSYRKQLVEIEQQLRERLAGEIHDDGQSLRKQYLEVNQQWLEKQRQAADNLKSKGDGLRRYQDISTRLLKILESQSKTIEASCRTVEQSAAESDHQANSELWLEQCLSLLDSAHQLRDAMLAGLVVVLRDGKRLDSYDRRLHYDPLTKLHNRSGLELIFRNWYREDSARQRMLSAALIDIDQFGELNRNWGTQVCDNLLNCLGQLFEQLISKDTGLDRACRFQGQTFALFFGDTGPRNALSTVERIRQTLESTSFEIGDNEFSVSLSAGVAEVDAREDTDLLFARLGQIVEHAKQAGRNRTFLDEGDGPVPVDPPKMQVKSRVVHVDG